MTTNKQKTPNELVLKGTYSIQTNKNILSTIELYCNANKLCDEAKSKMLIFTSIIYSRMVLYDLPYVNVSKNLFVKTFSTLYYSEIKQHCLNCTIDIVHNHNQEAGIPIGYKVKPHLFNKKVIVWYPNNLKTRFSNKLKRIISENYNEAKALGMHYGDNRVNLQNDYLMDIISYYSTNTAFQRLQELTSKNLITTDNYNTNIELFKSFSNGKHFCLLPDKQGRIYNFFTYVKRESRSVINKDYIEADISNSHPFIFSTILHNALTRPEFNLYIIDKLNTQLKSFNNTEYNEHKSSLEHSIHLIEYFNHLKQPNNYPFELFSNSNIHNSVHYPYLLSELNWFSNHTQHGTFYDAIVRKNYELNFDLKKAHKKICNNLPKNHILHSDKYQSKDIIKRAFMYWFNGKPIKQKCAIREVIINALPNTSQFLNTIKQNFNYKTIRSLIVSVESAFVFDVIHSCNQKLKTNIGAVHDGLFIKKEFLSDLLKELEYKSIDYFSTKIPVKVKPLN